MDIVVKKLMEESKMPLQEAVDGVAWTPNTNVNVYGFVPLQLVTGKAVSYPGITMGNIATESDFDSTIVGRM